MNDHSLAFLKRLLATPGPSGDEVAAGASGGVKLKRLPTGSMPMCAAVRMPCSKGACRVCCSPGISMRSG